VGRGLDFRELVLEAMRLQALGHSVGKAALVIAPHCKDSVEAHLISRAAQVHARWLAREQRVVWL